MSIVAATPSPRLSAMPMAPSSSDNMLEAGGSGLSPVTKRKIEDDNRADGKENGQPKRVKVESATSILDLPKRKVTFVQAPVTFDSSRRLKLDFEGSLLDAQDAKQEIANIPEEHWKYITLSGSELTSSTEALFINHLRKVLEPADLTGIITPSAWTSLIPKLFTLEQYGVLLSDLPSSTKRVPVALHIRAWEPKDQTYFTDEQRTILKDRREARIEARRQIEAALKALDDVELFELVKGEEKKDKKRIKPTPTDVNVQSSPAPSMDRKSREGTACSATGSRRSASPVKKALTAEEEEAMRIKLEEREAKRIAAEERKVAKEEKRQQKEREEAAKEQERQRKEAAMAKQKATMNSFFKPKVFGAPKIVAGPSKPREKDFDRIFKPVAMRPFVDWAPVNRFKPSSSIADSLNTKGKIRRGKLRTDAPFGTVGEKWEEYQDSPDPRAVLAQLNNKRKFPWKTLAFDQQTRPPYCGTFTKRSAVVGPRTPFAQDPLFDYSYDSGDDWQEDEGGEDVDDPEVEAELSDAESEQESEGEFDDWLDDESEAQMSDEDGDKQTKLQTKQAKRKEVKRVVKLAPFVKGPCWESSLGETDGMDVYRIQLLNDAPTGIDPFTYTSGPAQSFKTTYTTTSVGAQLAVKTLMSAEPRSTVDPAPVAPAATPAKMATADPAAAPKRAPKILFPDSHLAELLRLVEGNTKIQTDLVSQLKAHFEGVASKAAIEVKLKEVASRQGKSKESAWKVTDEAWRAAGLSPPSGPAGSEPAIVEQINGDVFS